MTRAPKSLTVAFKTLVFRIFAGVTSVLLVLASVVHGMQNNVQAISASDWRAGNIIADSLFYDNNSMSTEQIQSWLNSKISCDTNGSKTSEHGGGRDYNGDGRVSRAEWARAVYGYTGKFVCLTNYYENPTTRATNLRTGNVPSGAISAATIIKRAANTYNVSPKVLLVKLQKESPGPLTRDEWPLPSQFDAALGYACPDPPAGQPVVCDPAYKGFYRQIMHGARGIDNYKKNPNSFRYKPFQNNTVLYNPNTSCGSSTVHIANYATAGLYNYTPYQPNRAALNNLYGEGDACSAYGNRNFWTMYNNFFGSTQGKNIPPAQRITGPGSSSTTMDSGIGKKVSVQFKNRTKEAWYDVDSVEAGKSRFALEATHVSGGPSGFNAGFASSTRATQRFAVVYAENGQEKQVNKNIVMPGQTVRMDFVVTAPANLLNGEYRIKYRPINIASNGSQTYLSDAHTYYVNIKNSLQVSRVTGPGSSSTTMKAGETKTVSVRFKNIGTESLYDVSSRTGQLRNMVIEATHVSGGPSGFNAGFASSTRATQRFAVVYAENGQEKQVNKNIVMPGQTVRMDFVVTAPEELKPGEYRIAYRMLLPSVADQPARYVSDMQTYYVTLN